MQNNSNTRKAKIIATVGPSSRDARTVTRLIRAGVNVFRVNFSHGSHPEHADVIQTIRRCASTAGVSVGILADLQGPKIRTGPTKNDDRILLRKGFRVQLRTGAGVSDEKTIAVSYTHLSRDVKKGERICINDGAIRLRVEKVENSTHSLQCRVLNTGTYSSRKGVNFPDSSLDIPSLTKKDRVDCRFALEHDVEYIALSFVRTQHDIVKLRNLIRRAKKQTVIIAKIEKPEAIDNLGDIIEASDGIMVARGDLGVETSAHRVPVLQKYCIDMANRWGKLTIVATQMLEQMIHDPLPTRAEASDVANAVFDGTDAVMLSGETAVGAYPVQTVMTMDAIVREAEQSDYVNREFIDLTLAKKSPPHALCEAAAWAGKDLSAVPVVVFTSSGDTALYMSKIRNQTPILAFTPHIGVANMLSLAWNVRSFVLPFEKDLVVLEKKAETILRKNTIIKKNALLLFLCGTTSARGATNLLKVKKVD